MNKRSFNLIGTCRPETDYMVDISERVHTAKKMVDCGNYFTINRPRQYGKTTLISALTRRLSNEYICARISFESIGGSCFENEETFCASFVDMIRSCLENSQVWHETNHGDSLEEINVTNFILLNKYITNMCKEKKVVLIVDEVDKTSNNRVFLHFLGVLRDKFLMKKEGLDETFHSVILAGVHDIRNLKLKLKAELYNSSEGHPLNSPWNIASPFLVDMSFHANEIAGMINEYEQDHTIDMDVTIVSKTIYEYTSGYPFLVSQICKLLDEDETLQKNWTARGVHQAVKILIDQVHTVYGANTLFDDISKNLENYNNIFEFVYDILIRGKHYQFTLSNPTIQRAAMLGIIKNRNGATIISNRIFEIYITDYFTSKDSQNRSRNHIIGYKSDIIRNDRFDMEHCLTKFAELFREIYSDQDQPFLEQHGRMLLLIYLKPLINGGGFYHIESQLTDQRRMDLVVDYGLDQFIIELKLWYGESAHEKAYEQLSRYLKSKGLSEGYLLTYDFRKDQNRTPKAQWVEFEDIRIFDVVL